MSPTFLLDGNVAYTRIAPSTYPIQYGQNIGLDVLKIPGTNGPTVFESGIPEFQITGYETLGNPGSATPYFWHDNEYQYNANASWMKGKHSFRFGMDISRQDMNHLTAEQGAGPRGTFQFTGGVTALKGGSRPTSSMPLRPIYWVCLPRSGKPSRSRRRLPHGPGARVTMSATSGRQLAI